LTSRISKPRRASSPKRYANLAGVEVGDGFPVRIVGILNVSPESFYRGSVARGRRALQALARRMVQEGADILDIGAMSTAPYLSGAISEQEEAARMVAAVRLVREVTTAPLSVDTQRSSVAAAALHAGASILNDVSGLAHDPGMAALARQAEGMILMASERAPSTVDPVAHVTALLRQCLRQARQADIPSDRIVLDPGIGFFRRTTLPWYEFDCLVLARLSRLVKLGHPLLVGISRKSFTGKFTGRQHPADRLYGSLGATAIAVYNGAALVRTHDVAPTLDAVRMAEAIRNR
jgi:dihydropteroate synthase